MDFRAAINEASASSAVVEGYLQAAKKSSASEFYARRRDDRQSDLLDLLIARDQLAATLRLLQQSQQSAVSDLARADVTPELFDTAQRLLKDIESITTRKLHWNPMHTMPSQRSAFAAQRVFDVPELVEMILVHLSARDLLAAAQATRSMSICVGSSYRVQVLLGLQSKPNSFWRTKFAAESEWSENDGLKGLRCNIMTKDQAPRPPFSSRVDFSEGSVVTANLASGVPLPNIGSRGRAMLLCHPPIRQMKVIVSCCSHVDSDPTGANLVAAVMARARWTNIPPVKSSNGITVGELLDVTAAIRKQHSVCPFASKHAHDLETGEVRVSVSFTGSLKLRPDDPLILPRQPRGPDVMSMDSYMGLTEASRIEHEFNPKLNKYIKAKQEACTKALPIPTFDEFLAANPHIAALKPLSPRKVRQLLHEGDYDDDGELSLYGDDEQCVEEWDASADEDACLSEICSEEAAEEAEDGSNESQSGLIPKDVWLPLTSDG